VQPFVLKPEASGRVGGSHPPGQAGPADAVEAGDEHHGPPVGVHADRASCGVLHPLIWKLGIVLGYNTIINIAYNLCKWQEIRKA